MKCDEKMDELINNWEVEDGKKSYFRRQLEGFDEIEASVATYLYNLRNEAHEKTYEEIAEIHGVTTSEVRDVAYKYTIPLLRFSRSLRKQRERMERIARGEKVPTPAEEFREKIKRFRFSETDLDVILSLKNIFLIIAEDESADACKKIQMDVADNGIIRAQLKGITLVIDETIPEDEPRWYYDLCDPFPPISHIGLNCEEQKMEYISFVQRESDFMVIEVVQDGEKKILKFKDGMPVQKTVDVSKTDEPTGISLTFKLTASLYGESAHSAEKIISAARQLAEEYNIELVENNQQ